MQAWMSSAERVRKHRERHSELVDRVEVRVPRGQGAVIREVAKALNAGRVSPDRILAAVDQQEPDMCGRPFETWAEFIDAMSSVAQPGAVEYLWPQRSREGHRPIDFGED